MHVVMVYKGREAKRRSSTACSACWAKIASFCLNTFSTVGSAPANF